MKYLLIALIATCIYSSTGFAQTTGFLGKRTMINAAARLRTPFWYNYYTRSFGADDEGMKYKDGEFVEARNLLDYGLNVSATYALTRKIGFTANFGVELFKFHSTNFSGTVYRERTDAFYSIRRETYLHGSYTFGSLGLSISSRDGLLPIGLTHEVGFGFGKVGPRYSERNKVRLRQEFHAQGDTNFVEGEFVDVDAEELFNDQFKNTVLIPYYRLKMVRPINEYLLLSFGLQYSVHLVRENDEPSSAEFIMANNTIESSIRPKMIRNIVNFEIGLGYCF